MTLIGFIIAVAIVGFLVWLLTAALPMPEPFGKIIWGVAVLIVVIMLLQLLGVTHLGFRTGVEGY